MILATLLIVLFGGALISLIVSMWSNSLPRYITLLAIGFDLFLLFGMWFASSIPLIINNKIIWLYSFQMNWVSAIGIKIILSMDGISMVMVILTLFMGFISILVSPRTNHEGFYYFNILLMIAGVCGIFMAFDLFLFFFFWEMMLLPLYLLMVMYGNENNSKKSFKFLLYTQASGLLLLISIISLFFMHGKFLGFYTFNYFDLLNFSIVNKTTSLFMLGFLVAFFVKLPVIPFHGWLGGSFLEAPLPAVVTGLLIKTGAYGIIRFAIPLFPDSSVIFANTAMILGVLTILYGAFMAFSQDDLRLIAAYSSISHMGFILIGLFAMNEICWQGVILQMIASGVSSSAIIIIAYALIKRTGTCNITQLGGLWEKVPVLSGIGTFFAIASLGLPGMGNFLAEFMILSGAFKAHSIITVFASIGLVMAAAYSLRIIQKVFVGKKSSDFQIADFNIKEKISLGILIILTIWIGLFPKPILDKTKLSIEKIMNQQSNNKDQPTSLNKNEASVKGNFNF